MLRIIADEQIAHLEAYFASLGKLIALPAKQITSACIKDADILLVRTQTHVNAELLASSSVKFVGTATAGFDHLNTHWLQQNGVAWASAAGCNAEAVAEYVLACIAALRVQEVLPKRSLRVGIIGVGHVGYQVAKKLQALEFELVLNDPWRNMHTPLINCDVICVHAALHQRSPFPSYHLVNKAFLQQQKPGCVLINAARGEIVDSAALKAMEHNIFCLDVWENEPNIDLELVTRAYLATPHIAGYTQDAKERATQLLYTAVCNKFVMPSYAIEPVSINSCIEMETITTWEDAVLQVCDMRSDSNTMKTALLAAKNATAAEQLFLQLRVRYPWRREFSDYLLTKGSCNAALHRLLVKLGFSSLKKTTYLPKPKKA